MYIKCISIENANEVIEKINEEYELPNEHATTFFIPTSDLDGFWYIPIKDIWHKNKKKKVFSKVKIPEGLILGIITNNEYNIKMKEAHPEEDIGYI